MSDVTNTNDLSVDKKEIFMIYLYKMESLMRYYLLIMKLYSGMQQALKLNPFLIKARENIQKTQ